MVESEPTELSFEFTTAMHPDAQQLIQRLSDTLNQRVGDSGKSSFKDADPDPFVIARLDNEPVGCGAFREHSADTAEIKRMYAQVPGVGKQILKVLEESIRRKGYIRVILSTRKKNDHAMDTERYLVMGVKSQAWGIG